MQFYSFVYVKNNVYSILSNYIWPIYFPWSRSLLPTPLVGRGEESEKKVKPVC